MDVIDLTIDYSNSNAEQQDALLYNIDVTKFSIREWCTFCHCVRLSRQPDAPFLALVDRINQIIGSSENAEYYKREFYYLTQNDETLDRYIEEEMRSRGYGP